MNATINVNMRKTYFEHQQLNHIKGKPHVNRLHGMLLQLKANTRLVSSTLCRTAHGYIGIILLPATYTALDPMDPFITLVYLGALNVVHSATHYEIVFAKL